MYYNTANWDLLCNAYCGYDKNLQQNFVTPEQKFVSGMAMEVPSTLAWCGLPLLFSPVTPYASGYWQRFRGKNYTDKKYSELFKAIKEEEKALNNQKAFLSRPVDPNTGLATGEKYSLKTRLGNKYKYNALNSFTSEVEKITPQLTESTSKKGISEASKKAIETARAKYAEALKKISNIKTTKSAAALNQEYEQIVKLMQEGDIAVNEAKAAGALKPTSAIGKMGHAIKKSLGIYKAKGFILKTSAGANALKGLKGWGKLGVGLAIVTETLGEIPDLQGAKQIDEYERSQGRESNRFKKQCGKSAVKVGCAVAGGVLGSMAAGAAVGAACGTVVPVVGNIVGFVGGAIGGLIGGLIGSKIAGKSEVEKYQEEQNKKAKEEAEKLKKDAKKNGDTRTTLIESLQEAKESGELTDAKIIKALEAEAKARQKELEDLERKELQKASAESVKALDLNNAKSSVSTTNYSSSDTTSYTAPTPSISLPTDTIGQFGAGSINTVPIDTTYMAYNPIANVSLFSMPPCIGPNPFAFMPDSISTGQSIFGIMNPFMMPGF